MMRGSHARADGSFGRSAGSQTLKGAGLLFVALIIGVALLHTAPRAVTAISLPSGTPTTHPPSSSSGTTLPQSTTSTTLGPRSPSQVTVLVANGAGVANLGARVRGQLSSAGYATKPAIDAPTSDHATSSIYFEPGYEPDADQLAGVLSLPVSVVQAMPTPTPVSASALTSVNVLVILGQDVAGSLSQTTAPPGPTVAPTVATTPTTIHHTASTTEAPTTVPVVHTTTTIKK
jgi:hypothetical protein